MSGQATQLDEGHRLLVFGLASTSSVSSTPTPDRNYQGLPVQGPQRLALLQHWCHLPFGVFSEQTNLWVFILFPNPHNASQNSLSQNSLLYNFSKFTSLFL